MGIRRSELEAVSSLLLTTRKHIVIVADSQPDPDSIGSAVALFYALGARRVTDLSAVESPERVALLEDIPFPHNYNANGHMTLALWDSPERLPRSVAHLFEGRALEDTNKPEYWDRLHRTLRGSVVVVCDASATDRLGRAKALVDSASIVVNIDHHATNSGFGTYNLVDAQESSTTMIVLDLVTQMGMSDLTPNVRRALATGLVGDTRGFTGSRPLSENAMKFRDRLAIDGFDWDELARQVTQVPDEKYWSLLVQTVQRSSADPYGIAIVTDDDMLGLAADEAYRLGDDVSLRTENDFSGVVVQTPRGSHVQLRSRGALNVGEIADQLGGGGHDTESGVSFEGLEPAEVRTILHEHFRALGLTPHSGQIDLRIGVDLRTVFQQDNTGSDMLGL